MPTQAGWKHLAGIRLADPEFGTPGRIDLLLGIETFVEVIGQGQRSGAPGSPVALETKLGWVLAGGTQSHNPHHVMVHHVSLLTGDDLIRQFWETEEKLTSESVLTVEERAALEHFKTHHTRQSDGRFIVPLPRKPNVGSLGESRSQAMRRFFSFERSLHTKGLFQEFETVINEYFEAGHAEEVPMHDLEHNLSSIYLCILFGRSPARPQKSEQCLMHLPRRQQASRSTIHFKSVLLFTPPLSMCCCDFVCTG